MRDLEVQIQKKLKGFELNAEFQLFRGCMGILGASGCGKSMTLKSIAGIVTPDSGKIRAGEKVLFDKQHKINLPIQKRHVGYLFQNYALFPNMTVAQNIGAGVKRTGSRKKEVVERMIERFRLTGLEEQYPCKLSGGQQQRTALARILASEPDILLLDEPFSAMDSYLKEELQLELGRHLKQFDGAAVIVSHDRDEIYRLCDTTMIMENGKTLLCEDTKKLFADPGNVTAARLTGCKNISRAKRCGENRVFAQEWGVILTVERKIPENLAYVGIRAHDFQEVETKDAERILMENENSGRKNLIRTTAGEKSETPFEWTILFKNKENPKGSMWMKKERGTDGIPKWVRVDPGKVLLLSE